MLTYAILFQKQIIADLRKIPYIVLLGDLETRMRKVEEVLSPINLIQIIGERLFSSFSPSYTAHQN